eukprot:scaffold206183_cov13-Tisochrysis_lutea.AAC.1
MHTTEGAAWSCMEQSKEQSEVRGTPQRGLLGAAGSKASRKARSDDKAGPANGSGQHSFSNGRNGPGKEELAAGNVNYTASSPLTMSCRQPQNKKSPPKARLPAACDERFPDPSPLSTASESSSVPACTLPLLLRLREAAEPQPAGSCCPLSSATALSAAAARSTAASLPLKAASLALSCARKGTKVTLWAQG